MKERLSHVFVKKNQSKYIRLGFTLAAFAVTLLVLGGMIWGQRDLIFSIEWKIQPQFLAFSFVAYISALIVVAAIWSSILHSFGNKVSSGKNILYFLITNLGKRIPGTVWYIAWRAQLYREENYSMAATSIASGVEWSILMISGILTSLFLMAQTILKYSFGVWAMGLLGILCLVFLHPKILTWIIRKFSKVDVAISYRNIITWIALYILVWGLGGISLYCITNAFISTPFESMAFVIGSWSLVGVLSFLLLFLPTNLGFNEIGISFLLAQIIPSPLAVIVALASRLFTTVYDLITALVALGIDKINQRKGIL